MDGDRGHGSGGGDRRSVAGCRPISGRRRSRGESLLGSLGGGNILGLNDSDLPACRERAVAVVYVRTVSVRFGGLVFALMGKSCPAPGITRFHFPSVWYSRRVCDSASPRCDVCVSVVWVVRCIRSKVCVWMSWWYLRRSQSIRCGGTLALTCCTLPTSHVSEFLTRETAKQQGNRLVEELQPCGGCGGEEGSAVAGATAAPAAPGPSSPSHGPHTAAGPPPVESPAALRFPSWRFTWLVEACNRPRARFNVGFPTENAELQGAKYLPQQAREREGGGCPQCTCPFSAIHTLENLFKKSRHSCFPEQSHALLLTLAAQCKGGYSPEDVVWKSSLRKPCVRFVGVNIPYRPKHA